MLYTAKLSNQTSQMTLKNFCGLGNSDPAKLREAAQDVKHLSVSEIKKRQAEIQVQSN